MKPVHAAIVRLLDRLQERFRRARAGSVLILVVALLVLMALLGTAFISTARIDRYGAAQNAANTEIDLLVEGVKNLVTSAILDDLRDGAGNYRPPDEVFAAGSYKHADNPGVDLYLASRVPTGVAATPIWRSVSWPLVANGPAATPPQYQFDSPGVQQPIVLTQLAAPDAPKRDYLCIVSSALFAGDPYWPHLRIYRGATELTVGPGIPAADADGDGIADAGLWKLPISPIDGITYYAATRVIDNNSAVNGSLSWTPNPGAGPNAIAGNSFFPSDINFQGMLIGPVAQQTAAMTELNLYRSGDASAIPLAPVGDGAPGAQAPAARADFQFTTQSEALWQALGRRLDYPGYKTVAGIRYQSVPFAASASLAYRFCLQNQYGIPSVFEQTTNTNLSSSFSSVTGPVATTPYTGDLVAPTTGKGVQGWFTQNFDYPTSPAVNTRPMRALTVARSPVANARPSHSVLAPIVAGQPGYRGDWVTGAPYVFGDYVKAANGQRYVCIQNHISDAATNGPLAVLAPGSTQALFWAPVPWTDQPLKTSINTANFGELWHAFWDVMAEVPTGAPAGTPPDVPANPPIATGMFRDASRDANVPLSGQLALSPYMMVQLRSALAAVNAMDLRDSDNNVTSRTIPLFPAPNSAAATHYATVFGTEAQPYITEILVKTGPGPTPYVAIELYNPYPFPINMTNWRLVGVDRTAASPRPRTLTELALPSLPGGIGEAMTASPGVASALIPPGGCVIIENTADPAIKPNQVTIDVTTRYAAKVPAAPPPFVTMPGLELALDHEVCLMRPRRADGVLSQSEINGNLFNEGGAQVFTDLAPADQVDLTGVVLDVAGQIWVYRRGGGTGPAMGPWQFTSADISATSGGALGPPTVFNPKFTGGPRHTGLIAPVAGTDFGHLGDPDARFVPPGPPAVDAATFYSPSAQLANADFGGPNKTINPVDQSVNGTPHHFPFGGFARNGDMLQIPFFGAYIIREVGTDPPDAVREMNAVTMDVLFADDGVPGNNPVYATDTGIVADAREQVGRFCPVGNPRTGTGDFSADVTQWTHHWAMDLFDHLTVQAPQDDYLPDVDPAGVDTEYIGSLAKYPNPVAPDPVANAKYTEANDAIPATPEGSKVPVEGLININTAPWKVLAALPLIPGGTQAQIDALAQAIVAYRDSVTTPGAPFQTIYDLYKVPEFSNAQDAILTTREPNDVDGDFSPLGGTANTLTDGARFDFEERFLLLNRISNMITTRSDSYTVYLLVQGWQDAGTASPQLRTQRRLAFIVDRSRINPSAPQMTVTPVPNN
jgi:hypothetical protein